ncbi:DM13 domain-containing protein [Micromonospora sp. WMMD812]|uniref:DM13 domain-containing protein n=1 Tax=Micromonospora sp. WMMD812 TaxID=3015152 RepID=UPI00248C2122|nr:DM13 domain-containing protein [Micromonospora sp. WMMD812]WBB66505.1 DM13 domain-containing protein [Micromonospora sp. WMMD812]
MLRRLPHTPLTWLAVAAIVAASALGLWWFQPWKLVTDAEVDEELSVVASVPAVGPTSVGPVAGTSATAAPAGPTVVRSGTFVTHEHDTEGTARIVRDAAGRHRLELVGLATSNGPDLRVWLTDQPVRDGTAGWRVFDDGRWVELGRLKGNRGDQGYEIPSAVDLAGLTSVSIWCKRFAVSFGAAPLDPVG